MITVFLQGGLGNQMFQYALGLNLAKQNGAELSLDAVFVEDRFPRRNFTYRTFDLDVFALEPRFTPLSRIARAIPVPGMWLGFDLLGMKAGDLTGVRKVVRERGEAFDPSVFGERGNFVLFGYWQSEKYFSEIADDVRAAFSFRRPLQGEAARIGERIRSSNSISLHVRRGDFVALKVVERLMGKTDLSYYDRAVHYIGERILKPEFFVFSDDIAWCRENLRLPFPATFAPPESAGPKDAFHLELMSLCKHHIIANSTFSWWGAWLNRNPQKIVIAPRRWYAGAATAGDIVPENWIKM